MMDTSTVLTISGIVVTLALGGLSIYLVLRKQRYPGRITYVNVKTIALFDSIVRDLPEVSILYDRDPIGENLVLLEAFLLNTGTKDISPDMIEGQIALKLPDGFRWLTANVVASSPDVRAEVAVAGDRELKFATGLFRRREHIRFQALVEVPNENTEDPRDVDLAQSLRAALSFDHRIADTRRIDTQEIQTDERLRRSKRTMRTFGAQFILAIVMACTLGILLWLYGVPTGIRFILTTEDSKQIAVRISAAMDGTLQVSGVDGDYEETTTLESFFTERTWRPKPVRPLSIVLLPIPILIMILITTVPMLVLMHQRRKDNSLRELLSLHAKPGVKRALSDQETPPVGESRVKG